jgi:hypothetical protein
MESVPPPPGAGGGAHRERADRFRTVVAIAIAVVSMLGAAVAFRGSLTGQEAHRLDQDGIQEAARKEQIVTDISASVNEDLRNLAGYQEHVKTAKLITDQANSVRTKFPDLAEALDAQAQSETVLARTQGRFFRWLVPAAGDDKAPVEYDKDKVVARALAQNEELKKLRPDATLTAADEKHTKSVYLVGLVTLFIAALLFLTVAQFIRERLRAIFAAAGGAATLLGIVLWFVVERHYP